MLDTAEMIAKSARFRTESRGAHFREDYPQTRSEWLRHTRVMKNGEAMEVGSVPVVITNLKPEVPNA
jgi:succinate dehydrogenase / fumarate reductase flavoprotein subunit